MRIFSLQGASVAETDSLSTPVSPGGFLWLACTRSELESQQPRIQHALQAWCGVQLVDLHVADLLNPQLPSHYDYTSQYDVLVFRRLTAGPTRGAAALAAMNGMASAPAAAPVPSPFAAGTAVAPAPAVPATVSAAADGKASATATAAAPRAAGPVVLRRIDTSPVGFAVFDSVLLTVHPEDCGVRDAFAARLLAGHATEARATGARQPTGPADLMLRLVNLMVDGYLDLRRELNRQLDHWQTELLKPKARFTNWGALLDSRLALHHLDQICEDQRAAVQDWIDALETWPAAATPAAQRERDLLQVRSRDVLEHIERVVHHVRRLEQSSETTVQMHFSLQSNRTNDIMRVLTTLTAIFLPLNLIAGIFGMNFEFIPLTHKQDGFWWAMASMGAIAVLLILVFWRKKYLERTAR